MPIASLHDGSVTVPDGGMVIVGAGAVGICLAVALARRGTSVTLLEAGPRQPPADYTTANRGPTAGRAFQGLEIGRMKAFGGTTRLWGGQLIGFDRGDIESVDRDGRKLWPIGYEEVAPWLEAAFDFLGIDPESRAFDQIYRRATGHDCALGHGLRASLSVWLRQPDFTKLFADELNHNPLITVITDAEVTRMHFAGNGRLEALDIAAGDGRIVRTRPERVVLASGTFEIARQLLRAQALDPGCPFGGNANLGRWYIDHLHGIVGNIVVTDTRKFSNHFDQIFFKQRKYTVKLALDADRPPHTANIICSINHRLTIRGAISDAGQLMRRLIGGKASPIAAIREAYGLARLILPFAWRYLVAQRAGMLDRRIDLGFEIEQLPDPDSYLFLDPQSPPETAAVGVHWNIGGGEMAIVGRFGEAIVAMFDTLGLGTARLDRRGAEGDPAFFDAFHNSGHYMGGARMADTPQHGVVDRNCRVFGTTNLFIAGSAVFPSGSFANSTLTAIALGLRLADHLVED